MADTRGAAYVCRACSTDEAGSYPKQKVAGRDARFMYGLEAVKQYEELL